MESIKEIYRIGYGPSSSHTMGPRKAAQQYLKKNENFKKFRVTLYGSLALTGKGHLTDKAIEEIFTGKELEIVWEPKITLERHPNALKFETCDNKVKNEWIAYSIGGGKIIDESNVLEKEKEIYPLRKMQDILNWCYKNGKQLFEFVYENEDKDIKDYLFQVWTVMQDAIHRGLEEQGSLPGELKLARKAASLYTRIHNFQDHIQKRTMVYAYALAVSEENAGGGKIVTAPTCGSCGVLPAILFNSKNINHSSDKQILNALATAGLIGNLVKTNASISGAEVGCQGEVGTACAMASGALTQLKGGSIFQIESAAEMGIEHHLGLTCDPVAGLVQIPCIERNALAAARALNHTDFALLSDGRHLISFDRVVKTMKQTGKDMPSLYRETSEGGLAKFHGIDLND
jgi:L-serine dehydratase